MGKIINTKELMKVLEEFTTFFEKKNYSEGEVRFIIGEFSKSIEVFEKYNQGKALRKTLEELGGDL